MYFYSSSAHLTSDRLGRALIPTVELSALLSVSRFQTARHAQKLTPDVPFISARWSVRRMY